MRKLFLVSALTALACARQWALSYGNTEEPNHLYHQEGVIDIY
jgi:hypothetical protein